MVVATVVAVYATVSRVVSKGLVEGSVDREMTVVEVEVKGEGEVGELMSEEAAVLLAKGSVVGSRLPSVAVDILSTVVVATGVVPPAVLLLLFVASIGFASFPSVDNGIAAVVASVDPGAEGVAVTVAGSVVVAGGEVSELVDGTVTVGSAV